jgi:hypothetical protein
MRKSEINRRRDMDWLNGQIRKRVEAGSKTYFKVEAMTFVDAVLDSQISDHASRYIIQSFETAMGLTDDPIACYCCGTEWHDRLVPVMCVFIEFVAKPPIKGALLAGVCPECSAKGHGEMLRVIKRDFPYLADNPSYMSSQRPGNA